jgi:hypothetical protein
MQATGAATVRVPVYLNTSSEPLQAVDVLLSFNPGALRVSDCAPGRDLSDLQSFACRYDLAGQLDSVQMSYAEPGAAGVASSRAQLSQIAVVTVEVCWRHKASCRAEEPP